MRILFSAWPAYGHLLPMLPLARAAVRDGHDVMISSGCDVSALIRERGFVAHQAGPTLAQAYAAAAQAMSMLGETTQFSEMTQQQEMAASARHFFGPAAAARARDLQELLADWRPDLVIHDNLELGAPTAAESFGIEHVTHSYGPVVPGTAEFGSIVGRTLAAAGLPDSIGSVLRGRYLDICPPSLQPSGAAPWSRTIPLRPSPGEVFPGEELPAGFTALPHPRTIYLTLGTIMNQRPQVFRDILEGCCRLQVNVVATTGPGVDPAHLGTQPDNVLVLPYLPQAVVMPHCDAVISHIGAGTMLGALCFGLPQLCLPQGTDQPQNAAALVRAGAGLVVTPDEITPDAIATSLRRVLGEPGLRQRAEDIQAEIEAMPDPDDAWAGLVGARAAS